MADVHRRSIDGTYAQTHTDWQASDSGWKAAHLWGLELPAAPGRSAVPLRIARTVGRAVLPGLSVRLLGGASLAVLTESAGRDSGATPTGR